MIFTVTEKADKAISTASYVTIQTFYYIDICVLHKQ